MSHASRPSKALLDENRALLARLANRAIAGGLSPAEFVVVCFDKTYPEWEKATKHLLSYDDMDEYGPADRTVVAGCMMPEEFELQFRPHLPDTCDALIASAQHPQAIRVIAVRGDDAGLHLQELDDALVEAAASPDGFESVSALKRCSDYFREHAEAILAVVNETQAEYGYAPEEFVTFCIDASRPMWVGLVERLMHGRRTETYGQGAPLALGALRISSVVAAMGPIAPALAEHLSEGSVLPENAGKYRFLVITGNDASVFFERLEPSVAQAVASSEPGSGAGGMLN